MPNRFLKEFIKDIIYFFLSFLPHRRGTAVLMYHSVGENKVDFTVRPKDFRRQMAYLKQNNYQVISAKELINLLKEGKTTPPKSVVLTFDDGYEDNYHNVFPLLKEYGFPATIFLVTDKVGATMNNSQNIPLKTLSWAQIEEMHNSGLTDFEPHSLTHSKLDTIDPEELEREVRESKTVVEERLHKKCFISAYPKGRYNQQTIDEFKRQGFEGVFTVQPGLTEAGDDFFRLKRNSVKSTFAFSAFKSALRGMVLYKWWKYGY